MNLDLPHHESKAQSHLQPSQIVHLELDATRLYAEVVQIVEVRRLCWARPLVLVVDSLETGDSSRSSDEFERLHYHDLRHGSDLLLPAALFRPAMDVEAIPLLSALYNLDELAESEANVVVARRQLNEFIRRVCQAHPDVFSDKNRPDRQ